MSELSIFIVMHHYKPMERIAFALELTISSLKRIDYLYVLIRTFYFTVSMQYLIVSGSFFNWIPGTVNFTFLGPVKGTLGLTSPHCLGKALLGTLPDSHES